MESDCGAENFKIFSNWANTKWIKKQNFLLVLQKTLAPAKFSISVDKKYLLLAQNVQKLFRHSFLAQYTVFDIQTRWVIYLATVFRARATFKENSSFIFQWIDSVNSKERGRMAIFIARSIYAKRSFSCYGIQFRHLL